MVDAEGNGLLHLRLGVQRHAHAGGLQHRNVIGAVAHGDGIGGAQAVHQAEMLEGREFGLLAKNGFGHLARQLAVFNDEIVGLVGVKADAGRDLRSELAEAAGKQGGVSPMRLHGGNQGFAAGHEGDALAHDAVDGLGIKPRHQPDALFQRIGKIDIAAHGARRNGFDLVAKAGHDAKLINAFLLDHG